MLVRDLHGCFTDIRLLTGEHLIRHDSERVDIAPRVCDSAGNELGGEVGNCAEKGLTGCRVVIRGTRESEVAELDSAVVGEQHVLGLEIAVNDSGLVCCR